jgi:hypothetical protein
MLYMICGLLPVLLFGAVTPPGACTGVHLQTHMASQPRASFSPPRETQILHCGLLLNIGLWFYFCARSCVRTFKKL